MRGSSLTKRIANWTMPPGFHEVIRKYRARRVSQNTLRVPWADMEPVFARNKKFYNIHRGERCFILATGPSINKQDLRPLKNEVCIGVSMFFLHKDVGEIDPLYHVEASCHPPYGFDLIQQSFEGYERHYSERTVLFWGHTPYEQSAFNFLQLDNQFRKDNVYFLNYCCPQSLNEANFDKSDIWDICGHLFAPRTSVYCAIQVAAYMGFRQIYLLGCDHDYLADLDKRSCTHFYPEEQGYDQTLDTWPCTEDLFLAYHIRWKQYRLMRSFLELRGCHIYNATDGGLLDVFPRVSLNEVLASKEPPTMRSETAVRPAAPIQ